MLRHLSYCPAFFAGRDDSSATQVRRTKEHSPVRQHWEPRAGRVSPGTGRKNPGSGASFAPFRELVYWQPGPRAVRPGLLSFALTGSERSMLFAASRFAGRLIPPGRTRLLAGRDPLESGPAA